MKNKLTLQRFESLVAAYGGDVERFPAEERAGARALLEASEEARALCRAELELDLVLGPALEAGRESLSPELERKLAEVPSRKQQAGNVLRLRRWALPGVAWAAAACLGLVLGNTLADDDVAEVTASSSDAAAPLDDEALLLALASEDDWESP